MTGEHVQESQEHIGRADAGLGPLEYIGKVDLDPGSLAVPQGPSAKPPSRRGAGMKIVNEHSPWLDGVYCRTPYY